MPILCARVPAVSFEQSFFQLSSSLDCICGMNKRHVFCTCEMMTIDMTKFNVRDLHDILKLRDVRCCLSLEVPDECDNVPWEVICNICLKA